jgi:hypothetical protein
MPVRSLRRWSAALALLAVAAGACSSSSKDEGSATSSGSGSSTAKLGASARGVTADAIRIGLSFPDLEALAKTGLIKVDNGDYAAMAKALVDDVNAQGGVNGRKLELSLGKYGVLGAAEQLAACTKLTEDDKVFAILGGFIGDNNLCATQQHSTLVIFGYGAGFNQIALAKARAPFVTFEASDERSTEALVKIADAQGRLKGKTIGVYGTLSTSKPLIDLTVKALKDAGYSVADTAINDAPATDAQAFNAQDKVIGNRFKDKHIDTVFVQVTVPPGGNWNVIDYHPTLLSPQTSLVMSGAFTNGYDKFPLVAGLAASGDDNLGFNTPAMKHCREVWKKATGKDIKTPNEEQQAGKSTGFAGMSSTCSALQIFVAAAKAAGPNLTYATWQKALEGLGKMELPAAPEASFGPGKPDGQDSFQLMKFNPAWKPNTPIAQLLPLGEPITLTK